MEKTFKLALEIGSEYPLPYGVADFLKSPEAATIELILWGQDGTIIDGAVDVDQFALTLTFEDILSHSYGDKISNTQLLANLSAQSIFGVLAIVNMATDRGVPLARLDIFPFWASLQVDVALGIEHMEMDDGVQQMRTTMTLTTRSLTHDTPLFINNGE